jgi:hypothetical protein
MKKIALFVFLLLSLMAHSQDLTNELLSINKHYENLKNFEAKISYKTYADFTSDKVVETKTMLVKIQGNNLYNKIDGTEMIKTSDFVLLKSDEDKTITLFDPSSFANPLPSYGLDSTINGFLKICKSQKIVKDGKTTNRIKLDCPSPQYHNVEIIYDKNDYSLQKIVIFYDVNDQKTRFEIEYITQKLNSSFDKDVFTFEKYLKKVKNNYELESVYKDYVFTCQICTEK